MIFGTCKSYSHADAFNRIKGFPEEALLMLLVFTSSDKTHDSYSVMHAIVCFASVYHAGFSFRIKLSTKKDQKGVINFVKNSMTLQILKRSKWNQDL